MKGVLTKQSRDIRLCLDSWIDEVHESASWLCIFLLSPLLNLGSSDRSHNGRDENYELGKFM